MVWAMEYGVAVVRGGVYTVDVKGEMVIVVVEKGNTPGKVKGGTVMAGMTCGIVMVGVTCEIVIVGVTCGIVTVGVTCGIVMVGVTCGIVMARVIGGKRTSNRPSGSVLFILSRLKNSFKLFSDCSILAWVSEISSIFPFTSSTSWLKFLPCMASPSILARDLVL